jgi:hypothetical protein
MEPFYAYVVTGGTSGQITVRPEQPELAGYSFAVNAVKGPTYVTGQRVVGIWVGPFDASACVLGVVQ